MSEFKCIVCNKKFGVGDWKCKDEISNHIVEAKVYRSLDAPTEPGRYVGQPPVVRGRTTVCNVPPPKQAIDPHSKEVRAVGEGSVEFINGRFTTTDPEIQYWLDKKPGYNATEEQWKRTWLTMEEQIADERARFAADKMRLENERNELLAMTRQQKGA